MKKIFIAFVGIDGSGKSTLSNNTYKKILKEHKIIKKYGRFIPICTKIVIFLARKIFLKNSASIQKNYKKYIEEKRSIMKKHQTLTKLFISLILIEYFIEIFIKIIIPRKMGFSIIVDRYVYDTVINDLAIDLDLTKEETHKIIKKFLKILPNPDITFFVNVSEEIAFKRKNDIPSINYLKMRNKYYQELVNFKEVIKLDGSLEIERLEVIIFEHLKKIE